jgi:hypothetical protein
MHVRVEATAEPPGVEIVDRIERRRTQIRTADVVDLERVATDEFSYPVDAAGAVKTTELRFDRLDETYVRDADGSTVAAFNAPETAALDPGSYTVEVSGPIKLYCQIEGAMSVHAGSDSLVLKFPANRRVALGARSYHQHPAATITTPADPKPLMKAIGATSSALKTTSPERAYPTLRGHPPLLEQGDELSIPDGIESPATEVTIALPSDRRYVYTAAPLAFYLGADLVPGTEARIETPSTTHPLGEGRDFEDAVARTLKQTLFLDTVVRTEGIYKLDLYERRQVEPILPFDVASTYDRPLHERLSAYLEVPFESISEYIPRWVLTAHLPATPDGLRAVPFVVNDLGVIREPRGTRYDDPGEIIEDYAPMTDTLSVKSTESANSAPSRTLIEPTPTDESIDHAWFGPHVPVGASKASVEAFRNRLDRDERSDAIDITVVCNDERMLDEHESLDDVYGQRKDLPFDVTSHFGLSRDGFADLLEGTDGDFLHYIGHATPDGLRCTDGRLDVRDLDAVDIDVFFLNACDSYDQALALTERGALGGVGTLGDVVNEYAIDAGKLMARLLNQGFPLRAAVTLVREYTVIGDQYLVVGDGSVDLAQTEGGPPVVYTVDTHSGDEFDVSVESYPTRIFRIGSHFQLTASSVDDYYLLPGPSSTIPMDRTELEKYLSWVAGPVRVDSSLRWMETLDLPI